VCSGESCTVASNGCDCELLCKQGQSPTQGVARICSKPHHPPCLCLASPAWRMSYFVVGKRQLGWLGKHSILVVLAGLDSLDGLAAVHFA
jgi:hypothetical protein